MAFLHEHRRPRIAARYTPRLLLFAACLVVLGAGLLRHAQADEVMVEAPASEARAPVERAVPVATPEPVPEIRLRGEVVETACFIIGNRKGDVHRQCAIASARAGQDLGILDEKTQQLFVAIVDRRTENTENPLTPFIAHRVEAYGQVLEYGELPAVILSKVKSLRPPK